MSVLIHLCRTCGHEESAHEPRQRGYTACRCCLSGSSDLDPTPIERATFTMPGRVPEPLYLPGSQRNAGTMHAQQLCSCTACHARYAELTGSRRSA
ncbi:hypothetical protein ACMYYO_05810 [Dermacoccaceae bacterium W4C1]